MLLRGASHLQAGVGSRGEQFHPGVRCQRAQPACGLELQILVRLHDAVVDRLVTSSVAYSRCGAARRSGVRMKLAARAHA